MSEPDTAACDEGPEADGRLSYRDLDGVRVDARVAAVGDCPVPIANGLATRLLKLETGGRTWEALQIRPVPYGPGGRAAGYELLDNEILAGLRLHRAQRSAASGYPLEVSRLIGHDADAARPYALLEPYRGTPVGKEAGNLLVSDHHPFQVSLLTGVRWLGAAGIAHRGISPDTVRWDGRRVQITGFAHATVLGAPRTVVGDLPWCAPEQRSGRATGDVTERDDMWAAGRLIFYVLTGEELHEPGQLAAVPELAALLHGIFGPPEGRPAAADLLARLQGRGSPVPNRPGQSVEFTKGKAEFNRVRRIKHPETAPRETVRPEAPETPDTPAHPAIVVWHRVIVIWHRHSAMAWTALAVLAVVLLFVVTALLTNA